jgi:hypothetical protein
MSAFGGKGDIALGSPATWLLTQVDLRLRFDGDVHGFFNRALRAGKVALMQPHTRDKCEERTAMERGADLIAKHDALAEFLAGRGIVLA